MSNSSRRYVFDDESLPGTEENNRSAARSDESPTARSNSPAGRSDESLSARSDEGPSARSDEPGPETMLEGQPSAETVLEFVFGLSVREREIYAALVAAPQVYQYSARSPDRVRERMAAGLGVWSRVAHDRIEEFVADLEPDREESPELRSPFP